MVDPPRARDWSPLTEDGKDPVPGDWEAVKEAAQRYRNMSDLIRRCADTLEAVQDNSRTWDGETADAFRDKSTDLADSVTKAQGRYQAAASALEGYWPELKYAQEESETLRQRAHDEQDVLDTYRPLAQEAEDEDSDTHDQFEDYQDRCDTASSTIQSYRDQLTEIVEDKNHAAQKAADAINDFINNDGLKNSNSWWSGLQDVLGTIGEVAGAIAGIAGVLSIFLGWVPVLGQALALIAIVGTALSLIGNLANKNWEAAVLDVVGLASGGIISALGKAAKAAGAANRLRGFQNMVRGADEAEETISGARQAMGGTLEELTSARDLARADVPRGLSGYGREIVRSMRDDITFQGGGPYSLISGARDVTALGRAGQTGLALRTGLSNAPLAAIQGFNDVTSAISTAGTVNAIIDW